MDENIELLEYIYKNSEMSVYTLNYLLKQLKEKENKIKKVIEEEKRIYKDFANDCKKIIKKYKYSLKESGLMARIMSSMGIKKEVDTDNSDAAIAHMLVEGITMGIVDMETKIKNFKENVDRKVYKIAKAYLKYSTEEVERLKAYM